MARPADPTPACVAQQAAPAAPAAAPRRPPVDVGLLIQLLEPHEDFPTRVLEDIWHAIDGVTSCMPRRHKAFRWVCGHFGEAFLVWDEDDRDAVMAVLRAKLGDKLSWDDVKMTRRKYVAKLVRRYCPKPEVLRQRLEELWNTWHDCDDEEYGQLFNERAIVAWKLMLKRVDDGFYSDPDGLVLYIQVGVTEDGLPVYKCIRSTSDVEGGVHSVLRGAVITKGASVEHIEASLRNFTLRQSTNAGAKNMLGLTHRSHYEHWTRDSICEKAALVGVAPSFCPPPVLATRLATKETFFVAPAPVSWLRKAGIEQAPVETQVGEPTVDGKPVGVVNRVWAKRRPTWDYLGRRQRIKVGVAAMPGGTRAEWKLYEKFFAAIDGYRRPHFRKRDPKPRKNDPLGLRRYDFDRLARDWTAKVVELYSDRPADTVARKDRLTFKYNHHLKAAFSVWATRRLTKRGVMRLKRSELSLFKAMTDASVAAVLPAEKAQPKRLSAAARVQQTVPVAKPTAGPGGVMDVDNVERTEEVRQQQVPLRQTFFGEPGSGNSRNKTGKARTKCGVCIFNACKKDCPVGSNRRDNCPCRHPLFPPSKGKWRVRDGPPTAERRARLAVPPPYSTTSAAPDLDLMDTS